MLQLSRVSRYLEEELNVDVDKIDAVNKSHPLSVR